MQLTQSATGRVKKKKNGSAYVGYFSTTCSQSHGREKHMVRTHQILSDQRARGITDAFSPFVFYLVFLANKMVNSITSEQSVDFFSDYRSVHSDVDRC